MKSLWKVFLLALGAALVLGLPGLARTDEPLQPGGGLSGVRAFDVRIHLDYRSLEPDRQSEAESDWTGVVQRDDDHLCHYAGSMQVRARVRRVSTDRNEDCTNTATAAAEGGEEQSMALTLYQDGTYEFGFGGGALPGTQTLRCTAGRCTNSPETSEIYSSPLSIRLPIPQGATRLSGTRSFDSSWENGDEAAIPPSDRFEVTWSFTPVGTAPRLQAVPRVATRVPRGEPVTLDGTASTGRISDYLWTFQGGKKMPDGSSPDMRAELHGARVQVVLLDGMQVQLTVTDGQKTDSRTVSVAVVPRASWKTRVAQEPGEVPWDVPAPMYGREKWFGGENVCAWDPPAGLDEPTHILHPPSGGYALARVSDAGPYAGACYVQEWRVESKRLACLNKWVLEDAPPILPSLAENFYRANLRLKTDVEAYLAAARKHEQRHTELIEKSLRAGDPARVAERTFGREEAVVRGQVDRALEQAEKAASRATRDPLPTIWSGRLAVPTPDTGEWKIIRTKV